MIVLVTVSVLTYVLVAGAAGGYTPGAAAGFQQADIDLLRHTLGLDRPLYTQYATWAWALLQGNFGHSFVDGTSVLSNILARLPNTLELTATAMVIGLILSIPMGVIGAVRRGHFIDHVLTTFSVGGFAVPQFWLGLMLILLFSVDFHAWGLPWLPSSGAYNALAGGDVVDRLEHLLLPAITLAFVYVAAWSRYVRSSMLTILSQDYVRTARAKGMSQRRVLFVHALRNGLLPLVTLMGLQLPALVSGSLIVEVVFSWPGVGRYAYDSATGFDYPSVMGVTIFVAIMVILGNLLADIFYAVLDPRIKQT
jgi:peptide/nickel transport system permease protein